jgi:Domain of unknown function (DUF4388)
MSILLSGTLQKTSLSDILEDLSRRKTTGTLSVRRNDVTKSIYVRAGQIIFAASTDPCDRLGESLVKAGKITHEKLEHALDVYNKNAGLKKMGAVLVESGIIPPKELFSGLKIQVRDIIFSLFLWREGDYSFEEKLPPYIIQLHIDLKELITEIIERMRQEN